MDSGENDDTWWYRTPSFFTTMEKDIPLLSQISCAAGNGRLWNNHYTQPIRVHVIMISLPKWKKLCEGLGITSRNKAQRFRWSLDHRTGHKFSGNWFHEKMSRDSYYFVRWTCMGWWLLGERLFPECIVPTTRFGVGRVMVWGYISYYSVEPLLVVCGTMNPHTYCTVPDNEMLPTL